MPLNLETASPPTLSARVEPAEVVMRPTRHEQLGGLAGGVLLLVVVAVLILTSSGIDQRSAAETGLGKIRTSAGPLVVDRVEIATRLPKGCTPQDATGCFIVDPGLTIVRVWIDGDPTLLDTDNGTTSVRSAEGKVTREFQRGGIDGSGQFFVDFTPPAAQHGFTLHWPGNPPIDLLEE